MNRPCCRFFSVVLATCVVRAAPQVQSALPPAQFRPFELTLVSTGTGQILPYRIRELDALGNPTPRVLEIRSREVLDKNLNAGNRVLPVATWPVTPTLPNGLPGNQFLLVRFSSPLQLRSILSDLPANHRGNSGLTGALQVVEYDPVSESTAMVSGIGFVGGRTFLDDPTTPVLDPVLVRAVARSGSSLVILDPRANGFPLGFPNDVDLVEENTFVFVPDNDQSLGTIETFPPGKLLRVVVSDAVTDTAGAPLAAAACVVTTVGPDTLPPQVIGWVSPNGPFAVAPGNGATNVDPYASVSIRFTRPVDPWTVGQSPASGDLTPSTRGVSLTAQRVSVSYPLLVHGRPRTHLDLCEYELLPAQSLPCGAGITVGVAFVTSLSGLSLGRQIQTSFTTTSGPGLVNAPVAPEAIYLGIGGRDPGVAVLDLNGFGQGTGSLQSTRFRLNPNVGRPGVFPSLAPGTSNLDAGGDGALTLTRDDIGGFRLLAQPLVGPVADMALGQPLDLVFHNEDLNGSTTPTNRVNPATFRISEPGNTIMAAPHPNPPRLVFPPPNAAQGILTEEPTVTSSAPPYIPGLVMTFSPPCALSPLNRLIRGNPYHQTNPGIFDTSFEGVFNGPQPPPPSPNPPLPFCPYTVRQQVGQFLYVIDRDNRRVLAVNSNRFTVLASIPLADPTRLGMAPNLKLLAVSNFATDTVSFIDVDPLSPTFHRVTATVRVGRGPLGLAWQPEGEDLFVCNQTGGSVSVVHGATLRVRKTLSRLVATPVDVAMTLRQTAVGFGTGTYHALVLNGDGTIAVFESGPGLDDVIGLVAAPAFRLARAIQPDLSRLHSACWVTHQDATGLGQVSRIEQTRNADGDLLWTVTARYGGANPTTPVRDRFSGNSLTDVALDEIRNNGAVPEVRSTHVPGLGYAVHSGKGQLRWTIDNRLVAAYAPRFLFVAAADTGKLDVMDLATGARLMTLDVPGVTSLAHYWRQ